MSQYSFILVVSSNGVKPPTNFWISVDTTNLTVLRSLLDNKLPHTENRKVDKIEFYASWVHTEGNVKYNNNELKTDGYLKVM